MDAAIDTSMTPKPVPGILTADAPDGVQRRWFAAGDAHLAIDLSTSVAEIVADLADAALLGSVDPVLSEIERRCGCEYDWVPVPAPSHGLGVSVSCDDMPTLALSLPQQQHDNLCRQAPNEHAVDEPTPADDALAITITEHRVTASVVLDQFALQDEDTARLQPGAVVLLPGSFSKTWRAQLWTKQAGGAAIAACVDVAGCQLLPEGLANAPDGLSGDVSGGDVARDAVSDATAQAPDAAAGSVAIVALDQPVRLELDKMDAVTLALDDGAAVTLSIEGQRAENGVQTYPGKLLALGRGHAIVVGES